MALMAMRIQSRSGVSVCLSLPQTIACCRYEVAKELSTAFNWILAGASCAAMHQVEVDCLSILFEPFQARFEARSCQIVLQTSPLDSSSLMIKVHQSVSPLKCLCHLPLHYDEWISEVTLSLKSFASTTGFPLVRHRESTNLGDLWTVLWSPIGLQDTSVFVFELRL